MKYNFGSLLQISWIYIYNILNILRCTSWMLLVSQKKMEETSCFSPRTVIQGSWWKWIWCHFKNIHMVMNVCVAQAVLPCGTPGDNSSLHTVGLYFQHIDKWEAKQSEIHSCAWWTTQSISKSIRIFNVISCATSFMESPFQPDDIFIFSAFLAPWYSYHLPQKSPNREIIGCCQPAGKLDHQR